MKLLPLLACFLLLSMVGCTDLLLGTAPSTTPPALFDEFWHEFDARYSYFDIAEAGWDSLYRRYRPRVTNATPDSTLAQLLDSLIVPLNDAHVSLYAYDAERRFYYNSINHRLDSAARFDLSKVSSFYLGASARIAGSREIIYGLAADSIGYIYLATFDQDEDNYGWADHIDEVLDSLSWTKALVIDIRDNGGGLDRIYSKIAARFIPDDREVMLTQYRNGPGHSDFGPVAAERIAHEGQMTWKKPIALLTDRFTVSAAEWFTVAMRTLPNVMQIGDTTNGAFSGRLDRELSNGWLYSMSIERVTDTHGVSFEGRGIPPDITIHLKRSMPASRKDPVLDRAIEELSK